mgnify:CR=1 FL=1
MRYPQEVIAELERVWIEVRRVMWVSPKVAVPSGVEGHLHGEVGARAHATAEAEKLC